MSALVVHCPSCQAGLKVPATVAGKRIKCPKCGAPIAVPAAATAPPQEAVEPAWASAEPGPAAAPAVGGAPVVAGAPVVGGAPVAGGAPPGRPRRMAGEPPPRRRKPKQGMHPGLLWGLIGGGAFLLLVIGVVLALVFTGAFSGDGGAKTKFKEPEFNANRFEPITTYRDKKPNAVHAGAFVAGKPLAFIHPGGGNPVVLVDLFTKDKEVYKTFSADMTPFAWADGPVFSPSGKLFAWTDIHRSAVTVLNMETGQITNLKIKFGSGQTLKMAFDGSEKMLLTAGGYHDDLFKGETQHNIKVWDLGQQTETKKLKIKQGGAIVLAISPDGKLIAANDEANFANESGKQVRIFDLTRNDQWYTLSDNFDGIRVLAFSPDNKILAIGCTMGVVLWDLGSRTKLKTLPLDVWNATTLAFSPDGKKLAMGCSVDPKHRKPTNAFPKLEIWDVASGEMLHSELRHGTSQHVGNIEWIQWNAEGNRLISFTRQDVILWNVPVK